jgi:F-type H+-transporting ATPase subunit delta
MAGATQVLQRYATALHQLAAAAGAVERVDRELAVLDGHLQGHAGIVDQLASPKVARERKRALVTALLPAGAHDLLRRTLLLLVDKGRAAQLTGFHAAWEAVAMEAAGRAIAQVTSAAPLDDATRSGLQVQLQRLTGRSIVLQERVDPALLGGARILVGSRLIDGTVQARLDALRDRLLAAPLPAAD